MFGSVLIPLDGSQYSEKALAVGLELARLCGARVTLLTVILSYPDAHVALVPRLEEETRKRAESYLAPFLREGESAGFAMKGVVGHGEPAAEILRAAREAGADLIVMSTHGIGASGRHALGSVAMKVLQASDVPVLMVRIAEANPPA